MITVWRGTDGDLEPVKMECEAFGYPNYTGTGERMWDNSHFRTEAEAWNSILKSVMAYIALAARNVEHARGKLSAAEKESADACIAFVAAHDNYERWSKERKA